MAVAAKSVAFVKQHDYSHIIAWYRETLPNVAPPRPTRWEPIRIGPTWDWNSERGWLLPEHSMGWEVLGWTGYWLRDKRGQDWQWTPEQARFLLWYHSINEHGRLLYRTAVLQRLKGWGKDPLACGESSAHTFGPIQFDYFGADGQPVGRPIDEPWVQIVAVSKDQTANTMKLFPSMISAEARKHYGIQIGRNNVWGLGDTAQIQASSSNVMAVEGKRCTEAIRNEPQNWNKSNQGHELAEAIKGNSTKIPEGQGRILDIENAYVPSANSVAQAVREAWEATQKPNAEGKIAVSFGLLMDSLEAHPKAPMTLAAAPEVLESVRGDSSWLDIPSIVESIGDTSTPESESRRKWYNQIVSAADDWMDRQEWEACRGDLQDPPVPPLTDGERIVMFLDCSKSDDATALVGCRISDGHLVTLGVWARPPGERPKPGDPPWLVNRDAVDHKVREVRDTYQVLGFWVDPSGARDDETGERYWESYIKSWRILFGTQLTLIAVKSGPYAHPIEWDMRNTEHTKLFVSEAERFISEVSARTLTHDGNGLLKTHVCNAKRAPGRWGISLMKEHRESAKKIDAAVAAVGARMMYRQIIGVPSKSKYAPGRGRMITRR